MTIMPPRTASLPDTSTAFSERVGNVDHPVIKGARPVVGLLYGLVWICIGTDDVQGEVLVEFPVSVGVEFEGNLSRCGTVPECGRLIIGEPVAYDAPSQLVSGRHVNASLTRNIVGIGKEILASNLPLPPCSPIVETRIEWIERLALSLVWVRSFKECITVREFWLPG